jgi:hypothetical protein
MRKRELPSRQNSTSAMGFAPIADIKQSDKLTI